MVKIKSIFIKENYFMEIFLDNNCMMGIDFEDKIQTIRFSMLSDNEYFRTAYTDGICIRWNNRITISLAELFQFIQREQLQKTKKEGF